jgi:VCBS repeat-containing protein
LNFAGKSGWHADFGSNAHNGIDSLSKGADTVTVPDAHLLFSGDYQRSGADLIVSDHLHRVVVPNYFHGDKRPALVSPEGAPLDPKVIDALTGHVQYAQAGTAPAAKVVGHVVKMTGSASIVRNGVTIDVNNGDIVYQNDVVQTGSGSTLGLVMTDGTTFNLTANARLMMNDLTYDATSTSNTSLFTLVQGATTFVAGQVAKTGDMKVSTPVATLGIRGTAVILDISAIDGTVSVSVVDQRDGQIHALQVYNARGDLIGTVTSNGSSLTLRPTATFEVIAQESNKTVAQVVTEFNAFQQLLSTYEIGKQLVPNTPAPTDGRRGDSTQQPLTKFAGSTVSPIDSTTTKFNADTASTRDVNSGAGTDNAATLKPTGDGTGLVTKVAVNVGDAPVQFVNVSATSIPFVVTPSPVSRISSGAGDHFGPVMSADGQFVTYDPDGAIYLFDRQTGATKTIAAPGGGFTYGSPTISSDGHFVVYQGSDGTESWIFIYNNDASDPAHYGQTSRLMSGGQPAISGDASKLVIEQGGSIALYDQQGHELANITGAAVGVTGTLWKPAISADGHILAFWSSDLSSPGGAGQLFTYDLSTATVRSIASTATDAGNSAASFSADGHYVVYQSDAPGGHSEIYLYDLRAGQVVFHTANPDPSYNPVLSPDGHFIILASDARLTADDRNTIADIYVIDVTDPSHPAYKLVSVLDDGTQGDAASNLGAAISAGGQFIAFGSRASNFSSGDTPGSGDIFVVDPASGHSAIILESRNSPAVLGTSGVVKLTGDHSGVTLGVSDSRLTASFDSHGDIQWNFSEPRSDFASLQPAEISVLDFVITLSTDRSTTEIPVKVIIYDVDQPAVSVADAAPVASPVTLRAGTEDTSYTISTAALLAGVVDIDGPSLSITAVGVVSGGGAIVDNHDGTFGYTPAPNYNGPVVFNYAASDGTLSASSTATLNIAGVNDAPTVTKARLAVSEGGTVVLGAANIGVSDPDSTSFTFTISNVTHGTFQTTADGITWIDATTFTTADVAVGHVRFVHDGGEDAPTFSIRADDGEAFNHASTTVDGVVDFTNTNDAPTVSSAVTGGGAEGTGPATVHLLDFASDADPGTVLHVANLAWTDTGSGFPAGFSLSPDGNSIRVDTNNLAYNTLAQGETFTAHFAYDVVDEHGASVHQTATVTVAGTNDAPTVTSAGFNVSEGGTVVLGAANIGVADPDSTSFTFTVTNLSHGTFQITSNGNIWASATTFSTADLNASHVRFVHDGGEVAPTFSIRASDGAAINNQSNVLAGSVSFSPVNDAPVITTANLTIQEGGTVVLGASNLAVTDPDNNSFVFTASIVSHGTFQVTADGSIWTPVTTFNTANLNAGHVRFVHDGGEDAPTFSIQADDGTGINSLSNVLAGSVTFTHVNDAPVIAGPNPVTASVQEDATTKVVGQFSSTDPDGGAPVWSVAGGTAGHPASYSFTAYELKLTDATSPGSSFDDTLATLLQNSSTYTVNLGSFGASGGAVILDTAGAGNFTTDLSTEQFVGQFATRNQTILKSDAFTLDARFGLTLPDDLREGYGIRLNSTNPGTAETLELMVQAGENGSVRVRLRDIDHNADTDTTINTVGLNGTYAADDQIVLSLAHSAGTAGVTASFYIHHSNGTDSAVTTVGTDALFNSSQGITGASAQVFAYSPAAADSYITDAYGAFSIGATGAWDYALRNGTGAVQSLGESDHITETFNVQVADGNGGTDTRTINVTVNGSNDTPTVNAALTAAANEGAAGFTRNLLFGAADADNGETATLSVTGVTYSVDGGAASSIAPAGFSLSGKTLSVDPSNAAFAHLAPNQHTTVVVSYKVKDVNGAAVPQTETVTINGVNNAPVITHASLTISQGHTVAVTTADINFVDPDSPIVAYTVSNLSHGHFETGLGNAADVTTTFTSADVVAGLVSFVDDGSSGTPAFSLTPNDGITDGATVDGTVTFSAADYTMASTEGVIINVTPGGATSGFVFPGAGNVTTPGIPEDRIAIGYDVGRSHVVLDNAPLLGVHQMAPLGSETHISGDTTFVSTTLNAGNGVTLVQTLALGSDANFFTTTIDITNNGPADISNLRFLRNFDPDQDVQKYNDYKTFNDVVQNPSGAETFAIVSATGVESGTKVAMVGLGAEWRASVYGFTNTDPYATSAFDVPLDPNGAKADLSLSLTSSLGTLTAHGGHAEVTYITTNNVATSGSNALYGTDSADTINGLGGDDFLIGLGGADTFVFNAASGGSGHDTIADFTPGQDQISLDYHAFDAAGPNDFSNWLRTHATDINNNHDVLIDLNVDGLHPGVDTILLKNVASASLHAGDFHTV